jgi:hypothetical protein
MKNVRKFQFTARENIGVPKQMKQVISRQIRIIHKFYVMFNMTVLTGVLLSNESLDSMYSHSPQYIAKFGDALPYNHSVYMTFTICFCLLGEVT